MSSTEIGGRMPTSSALFDGTASVRSPLRDPEHEVLGLLAERLPHFLAFDHGRPVMGVHDPVTDFERHVTP